MRRAVTLIELIVIIIVLVVLGFLVLLPVQKHSGGRARIQETNNNLRRIVEAQIGYSSDAGTWAFPSGMETPDGRDPAAVLDCVGRIYVLLAKSNELSAKLFTNSLADVKPSYDFAFMTLTYAEILGGPDDPSSSEKPLSREEALRWAFSFAYDFTAPPNSAACRPIIGDRDPAIWGGKGACVAYGDGHATFVTAISLEDGDYTGPKTCETVTVDQNLAQLTLGYNVRSIEAEVDDWIYNFDVDLGEQPSLKWKVGRGSSTLAWLR